uniref:RNase H type-1 domain-containing protein n=1 Tax=Oryza nivara TaxID=4536 RepID=A0A0E0H8W7_ORYNI
MSTGLPQIPSPPATLMRPWCNEDEQVPQLTPFKISHGVSDTMMKQYEEDYKYLVEEGLDLEEMKKLYHELVRPVLVASCLILEHHIVSPETKALDQKFKDKFGKPPIYLSALDIMKTLIAMEPSRWSYLMDFLREKRILVTENWEVSLGSIECIMHDDSISFMMNGRVVFKGQSDGRYNHGTGTADLCTAITGVATDIVDCAIYREVPCNSPTHAELLGMYVLERRAISLKILLFDVKTDNAFVSETVRDMFPITPNTTEKDLCQVLRSMKVYFEHFNCRCEPREKLELVDSLMKMKDNELTMESIKDKWAHYLMRLPVFRAHQPTKTIRKDYINKAPTVGTVAFHGQFYIICKEVLHPRIRVIKAMGHYKTA